MSVSQYWGSLGPPPSPPPGNWDPLEVVLDTETLVLRATAPLTGTIPMPPAPPSPAFRPIKVLKRWKKFNPEVQVSDAKEQKETFVLSHTAYKRRKRKEKFAKVRDMYMSKLSEEVPPSSASPRKMGSGQALAAAPSTSLATSPSTGTGTAIMVNIGDMKEKTRPTIVRKSHGFNIDAKTFMPGVQYTLEEDDSSPIQSGVEGDFEPTFDDIINGKFDNSEGIFPPAISNTEGDFLPSFAGDFAPILKSDTEGDFQHLSKNDFEGNFEPTFNFDTEGLATGDTADRFAAGVEVFGDPDKKGHIGPEQGGKRQYTEDQLATLGADRLA
ncbi:unnamed protein product, partial [Prorocentrum cordatum]